MTTNPHQQTITVEVRLADAPNTESQPGQVFLVRWTDRDRAKRAVKILLGFWGAAVFSILIPMLHFVLVPGLLVLGPAAAYWVFQIKESIEGGSGTCPKCSSTFQVEKSPAKWPLNDLCSGCHSNVKIFQKE